MIRRILALLTIAGLAAGLAWFKPVFSLLSGAPINPHLITVKARNLSLVCPGAAFVSSSSSKLGGFRQNGSASIFTHQNVNLTTTATMFGATPKTLTGADSTFGADRSLEVSSIATDEASGLLPQGSALLTGSQSQFLQSSEVGGLAATACQRASSNIWLVGGDTRTGREALLILSNPTAVDATVELQLQATDGFLDVPGLSGISVPKHRSVIVPITGLAPKLETFSVHVLARGGSIAAWIQQKTVRGLRAAGFDLIAPAPPAATALTIPGLFVRGTAQVAELSKTSNNYFDVANTLRVSNSSPHDAHVLAQVTGSNAKTFGTVIQATVPANSTSDLEIAGISDGDYSIFLKSDQPVRAAAKLNRTNTTANPETDFTWLPSVVPEAGSRFIAVPGQAISKLSVTNPGKTVAQISLRGAGSNSSFALKPGSTASFKVLAGSVQLNSDAPVAATLIIDVGSSVASIPMVEYRNVGGKISVVVR
jgi:hypothetical protein